ncbi:MAG: hypothetical protein GTN73_04735 [Candidatus Aminicenantes bacterium]|nr:hypothetical protein [Candidatus Aminicenantes bacterium]
MTTLFTVLVVLPIAGAFVAILLSDKVNDRWAIIITTLTTIAALLLICKNFPDKIENLLVILPWIASPSKLFGFLIDPLSSLMLLVITIIGFLVVLYSTEYISPRNKDHSITSGKNRYNFWMLLFIGSMVGVAVSPNLLQLFIFWEMTTLCSWALISYNQQDAALKAGYKALLMTYLGGIFFMIALVILFVNTNSFEFHAIANLTPALRTTVFILLAMAAWAKAAQVPFYTWLPDAMEAPTPVSAYLHAAAMVKAGVYLLARVVLSAYPTITLGNGLVIAVMALATMFVGVFLYFFQDDLKRLLAFSTITQLAFILFGVSLGIMGSSIGFRGGVLHIVCHAVAKGLLFLSVGAIAYATGTKSIRNLNGLARNMPLTAAAFMIGVFSLTGIPPFSCFFSKFFIFTGALNISGVIGTLFAVLVILESLICFGWFLWIGHKVFFGKALALNPQNNAIKDPPFSMSASLIVLVVLCLVVPWIAISIVNRIM